MPKWLAFVQKMLVEREKLVDFFSPERRKRKQEEEEEEEVVVVVVLSFYRRNLFGIFPCIFCIV
jgi:hypothetical protein